MDDGGDIDILFNCAQLIADRLSCDLDGLTAYVDPNIDNQKRYVIRFRQGVLQGKIPSYAEHAVRQICSGFFGVIAQIDQLRQIIVIRE